MCEHCEERIFVLDHRKPVAYVHREEVDGSRSFLIIAQDSWLLHRCTIDDKPVGKAHA